VAIRKNALLIVTVASEILKIKYSSKKTFFFNGHFLAFNTIEKIFDLIQSFHLIAFIFFR
jgi:hypothetical protein